MAEQVDYPYTLPQLFRSIRIGASAGAGSSISAVWETLSSAFLARIVTVESVAFTCTRTAVATPSASVLHGWSEAIDQDDPDMTGTWSKVSGSGTFATVDDWECSVSGMTTGQSVSLLFEFDNPAAAAAHLRDDTAWNNPAATFQGLHPTGTDSVNDVWSATSLSTTVTVQSPQVWLQKRYFPGKRR